ncbi:MAG: hypothetical protein GY721_12880 [Deltaproteobacteria bacterium]|nr:hypothetical protein [Deltaproteobacteria bacterium]
MSSHDFERIVGLVSKDTKKGSEIVAKLFYRILRKNGFTEGQIINISATLLDCLTKSFKGYKKKVEETSTEDKK